MRKLFLLVFLCLLSLGTLSAQTDISRMRVSILTCAPGPELYSTFGHTAIRILDSSNGSDLVYNYGVIGETLNYDDPRFYIRFMQGKIKYMLDAYSFSDFMYEYRTEQRSVSEQELLLSNAQKANLLEKLTINLREENRYYKYDFWLDNCSTRPRDILYKNLHLRLAKQIIPENTTPRQLIHVYLDKAGQSWSKLGIDILLGQLMDKPIDSYGAMFLPDYLMKGLDSTTNNGKAIVLAKSQILDLPSPIEPSGKYVPLFAIGAISLLLFGLYYVLRKNEKATALIDAFLLFLTGLLGILLLVMWTMTDHTVCKYNWNILWAIPLHIIAAFALIRKKAWLQKYFLFCFLVTVVLIGGWYWLPQSFNISLVPFIILMGWRYASRSIRLR